MSVRTVVLRCEGVTKEMTGTEKEILHASTRLGQQMHGGRGCKRVVVTDKSDYDRYPQYRKRPIW